MPKLREPPAHTNDAPLLEEQTENLTASSNSQETPEPEIEVVPAEEPEVPVAEDPSLVLQKQIADLKRSEEIQRTRADNAARDRDVALQRANEREVEINRFRNEAQESQYDSVVSALSAANAEAEKAQLDIENALASGDFRAQAEATRRLTKAENNISKLEDGKYEIENRVRESKNVKAEPVQKVAPNDPVENSTLPPVAKNWLRAHPEYMNDPRKNTKLQALHWDVIDEGHEQFSPAYFESVERHLGLRESAPVPVAVQQRQPDPQQRTSLVSAPVSREAPTGSSTRTASQVRLTANQREAAKLSGITEAEYAKQLVKLEQMTRDGTYGGRQ